MDELTELELLQKDENEWLHFFQAATSINADQAQNMADTSFLYPGMSSDLVVGAGLQGIPSTSPEVAQLAQFEQEDKNKSLFGHLNDAVQQIGRGIVLGADAIWEEGFARPFRTSVLFLEDLKDRGLIEGGFSGQGISEVIFNPDVILSEIGSLDRAYQDAGESTLLAAYGDLVAGREVNLGTGFLPGYNPQQGGRNIVAELTEQKQNLEYRGVPNITFGRVLAHDLADDNERAFNIVSGGLDLVAGVFLDPAAGISKINQANRLLHGVGSSSRRHFILGNRVDRWLQGGEGRSFIDWAARTDSPTEFMRIMRTNDLDLITSMARSSEPQDLARMFTDAVNRGIVRQKPGSAASGVQNILTLGHGRSLSSLISRSPRGLGGTISMALDDTRVGRLLSNMPGSQIPIHDLDQAAFSFDQWMRNARMPRAYRDEIVGRLADIPSNNRTQLLDVVDNVMNRLVDDLVDDPVSAQWARSSVQRLNNQLQDTSAYWVDGFSSNPHQFNPLAKFDQATGTQSVDPHDVLETLSRSITLPDARDIRRAYSRTRRLHNKLRNIAGGALLDPTQETALTRIFDGYMSTWKVLQLMRGAWTTRVIGEEQVRMSAAGLTSMFNHPMDYIADVIFRRRRNLDVFGGSFADADAYRQAVPQEFAGSWFSSRRPASITEMGYTHSSYNRLTGEMGVQHMDGWTNEVIRLSDNPLNRALLTENFDDVLNEFMDGQYAHVRQRLINEENASVLGSREGARLYLESLNARAHSKLGGWRNGVQPFHVEFYDPKTNITRRVSSDEAQQLFHNGQTTPDQFRYVVDEQGDPDLIQAVIDQKLGDTPLRPNQIKARHYQKIKAQLQESYEHAIPPKVKVAIDPAIDASRSNMRDRFVESMFSMLMGRPTSRLSRSPAFRQSYWNRVTELIEFSTPDIQRRLLRQADSAGLNATELRKLERAARNSTGELSSLRDLDRLAKSYALEETQTLLYDLSKRNNFFDINRNIFPFADAWWEVTSTWTRLLFEKPQHINKLNRGITNLRNQGWFQEDPSTGEEMFYIPADPILSALTGSQGDSRTRFGAFTSSASIVGEIFPGFGPTVSMPYSLMRESDASIGTEFTEMIRTFVDPESLDEIITPYGLTPGNSLIEKIANANLPTWMRRTIEHFSDPEDSHSFSQAKARLVIDMYQQNLMSGQYDVNSPEDRARAQQDAIQSAGMIGIIRAASAFVGPVNWHPRYEVSVGEVVTRDNPVSEEEAAQWVPVQLLADYWRVIQEQNDYDDMKTAQIFMDLFGTRNFTLGYISSLSGNQRIRQYHATREGLDWARRNPELFASYPDTAYYINPEGSAYRAENFDFNAWRAALGRGDIEPLTPSEYAGKLEQGVAALVFDLTLSQALEKYPEDSPEIEKFSGVVRSELREQFPAFSREIAGLPASVDPAVQLAETYRWLNDDRVMRTDVGQAVAQYLEFREQAIAAMREDPNISSLNYTDFKAKEKKPYSDFLEHNARVLMQLYPDFIYIWNDIYRKELSDELERVADGS